MSQLSQHANQGFVVQSHIVEDKSKDKAVLRIDGYEGDEIIEVNSDKDISEIMLNLSSDSSDYSYNSIILESSDESDVNTPGIRKKRLKSRNYKKMLIRAVRRQISLNLYDKAMHVTA